jgi:hypothetical protein
MMKRMLFGCALPVLSLGLAAAFLAPSLLEGPAGEPLMVASAAPEATVELASFSGGGCAVTLLTDAAGAQGGQIAAVVVPSETGETAVAVAAIPTDGSAPTSGYLLVFDAGGRVIAASEASGLDAGCSAERGPAGSI